MDRLFQGARIGCCKGLGVWELCEKVRRHQVHADISALSRKNRRNQELERVFMMQRAFGVGIFLGKAANNFPGSGADRIGGLHGKKSYQDSSAAQSVFSKESFHRRV